ncbi:hypothetical protein DMN91_003406 [Ooceraea biroi]|uniref:CCHC-type domain-containing protein n=1 Tax=Ooceraea biroi TaxID=2015173 RepID=A0A3L8DSQ9_OOCBI|nr:calponin homology domain-containing protein DDB_G0272472-like [Ooceraea biroi]RLU23203.1 hypothetical protein DMN91_003406 [Ooceraea biroi]
MTLRGDDLPKNADDGPETQKIQGKKTDTNKSLRPVVVRMKRLPIRVAKRRREDHRKKVKIGRRSKDGRMATSPARSVVSAVGDELSETEGSNLRTEDVSPKQQAKRRGRGRPPTTGEYVGLAAAKKRWLEAERKEKDLEEEKELLERYPRLGNTNLINESERERKERMSEEKSEDIAIAVLDKIAMIDRMAKTSSNIKGTYVKLMRDIVQEVRVSTAVLLERTKEADKEEKRIMRKEIEDLKKEIEDLRKEVRSPKSQESSNIRIGRTLSDPEEEDKREGSAEGRSHVEPEENTDMVYMTQLERRANEERINPLPAMNDDMVERRILDRIDALIDQRMEVLLDINSGKGKEELARRKKEAEYPPLPPTRETNRKGKIKESVRKENTKQPTTGKEKEKNRMVGRTPEESEKIGEVNVEKRRKKEYLPKRIRGNKTAAISMRADGNDATTYVEALKTAKRNINIEEMGIQNIRIRNSATGGRILEIGGEKAKEKADELTLKLKEVLVNSQVRIRQVQRKMELQLWRLDDSMTEDEVKMGIAKAGCAEEEIDCGQVRRTVNGLGTVWIRLPMRAAWSVSRKKSVRIGWNVVGVTILEKRPVQCYKCLEYGHVQSKCVSNVVRSDKCYKCGKTGHIARVCDSESRCMLCGDKWIDDKHRMGDRNCGSKVVKEKRDKKGSEIVGEVMETDSGDRVDSGEMETQPPAPMDQEREGEEDEDKSVEKSFEEVMSQQVEAYHKAMIDCQTPKPQRIRMRHDKEKPDDG